MSENLCPDCGASWDEQKCIDHFHMMGFWELDHQLLDKHHLMVLCYNLQHPHIYSPQTLVDAKLMLRDFLETEISPQQMRQKIRQQVNSNTRQHKITGTPDAYGQYPQPILWTMTCADVIANGMENYYASIDAWAESVLQSLLTANELHGK